MNRYARDMISKRDMRNPYGSRGGYVTYGRGRRDRASEDMARGSRGGSRQGSMGRNYNYGMDSRYDYNSERNGRQDYRDYAENDMGRYSMDYEQSGQYDRDYGYEQDNHYGKRYIPIEAMGTFNGYWGRPQEDYGRYGRDMRYDYAGDYGEKLTQEELEHWRKKLDKEVGDEQSKHFFKKENIEQKARQMGLEMKHFNAEELAIASYMLYSDYCKSLKPYVGQNMDVFVKMGEEFLTDPDSAVKGGEKLALYFEIVAGEDD